MTSPTPSSAKATEDRQGEKPAEATWRPRWHGTIPVGDASDVCSTPSPQEGATAVGADDAQEFLEAMRGVTPADITQAGIDMAVGFIEALQGQVAKWQEVAAGVVDREAQFIARAEAAEASLRTLGDALERAREQNEWLKQRLADLQLPQKRHHMREQWLMDCGMPATPSSPSDKGADE